MAGTLRFWRLVEPTPGPVALRFGHYRPLVRLRFERPVDSTPGPVRLVFGPYVPPLYPTLGATLGAALPPPDLPGLTLAAQGEAVAPPAVVAMAVAAALPAPALPLGLAASAAVIAPAVVVPATVAAALPPPDLPLTLAAIDDTPRVLVAATLPAPDLPLAAGAQVSHVLDLPDADGPGIRAPHTAVRPDHAAALGARQQQMRATRTPLAARQQHAAPLPRPCAIAHRAMLHASRAARAAHQHGLPIGNGLATAHADTLRTTRALSTDHQHGLPRGNGARLGHQERIRYRHRLHTAHQHAQPAGQGAAIRNRRHGHRITQRLRSGHQQMIPLPVGWWQAIYPWPDPPGPPQYSSPVRLRFCRLADGTPRLVFGCPPLEPGQPPATVIIPIREAYLVLNTVTLVRADTAEPIEIEQFTASIDADSWTWGWSATLHADLMPLVRSPAIGQHVELIATVNGTPLRLVVERMGRARRFADRRLKISGRGRAAWLAEPHSPIETRYNATQRTAQQLLADALTINGVPIGWAIDWRITDWQVPAGSWSHTGTYIDAALRIAEAGGAYVQAHNTDQTLIIAPRYPAAPWDWPGETPDIALPEDVVEVEGIEWHDKPAYNAVWIAGGEGGRRDRIRRTGSAADRYAQSIVDPLATAPEMTRQRGLAVLGDTGRQAHISLRLPVLPETGIIQPGKLVRYTESGTPRLGLTRAVSIDHRFPELWQTIRVETHELAPV